MHPSSGGSLMPGIAESRLQLRRASDASANPAKSEHSSNRRAAPRPRSAHTASRAHAAAACRARRSGDCESNALLASGLTMAPASGAAVSFPWRHPQSCGRKELVSFLFFFLPVS
ncbi:unnamed protein product [Urochloa humidicola]